MRNHATEPTIILKYKRKPELVNDEHQFSGTLVVVGPAGDNWATEDFVSLPFHRMMTRVSSNLRSHPNAAVVLQRSDRSGLSPMALGEEMRELLRDDPVAAIRSMDIRVGQVAPSVPEPVLRSSHDTLADAFGERVYIRMRNGYAEDPTTGKMAQLATGPKCGWRIQGEGNSYEKWLPIQLEGVEGDLDIENAVDDPQQLMEKLGKVLAECKWASCSVEDLLSRPGNRFFLPRRWNKQQWITRQALRERLDKYRKERDSC